MGAAATDAAPFRLPIALRICCVLKMALFRYSVIFRRAADIPLKIRAPDTMLRRRVPKLWTPPFAFFMPERNPRSDFPSFPSMETPFLHQPNNFEKSVFTPPTAMPADIFPMFSSPCFTVLSAACVFSLQLSVSFSPRAESNAVSALRADADTWSSARRSRSRRAVQSSMRAKVSEDGLPFALASLVAMLKSAVLSARRAAYFCRCISKA